jgi:APA family basic amino acid/polyamine antiporter
MTSAVIGVIALLMMFGDSSAIAESAVATQPYALWSSVWFATTHDHVAAIPNTLTMIVLASNCGTFMLYMLSCIIRIVAYQKYPTFSAVKHLFVPIFDVLANVVCIASYLIGPFMGYTQRWRGSVPLAIAALWGIYGAVYFTRSNELADDVGNQSCVMVG